MVRRLFALAALLVALAPGCGGDGGSGGVPAAVGGSFEILTGALRWNEHEPEWIPPATQAWIVPSNAELAKHHAHHNGYDLFLQAGHSAPIRGKFHYGDLRVDLVGEKVGLYLHKAGAGAWTHVADGVTDADGRVEFAFPAVIQGAGTWFVKMVVYADRTCADALVRIVQGTVSAVVFDIDGTLTTKDSEMIKEVLGDFLDLHYVPRMVDAANKVASGLAKQGYEIVYLTARPYWLTRASRRWLALKGFPVGTVATHPGSFPAFGSDVSDFKRDHLLAMQAEGANFFHAFGNATTDITAYAEAGIPAALTYIIGPNAGQGGTIPITKYSDLFGTLVPVPANPYRVCLVIVDGLRPDALSHYLSAIAGPGSALKATFGTAVDVQKTATTAPSVTFSGNASIATGRSPAAHGVTGNHILDRSTGRAYTMDAGSQLEVGHVVAVYSDEGMANGLLQCQTLYEQMSASGRYGLSDAHQYYRGAEYLHPSYYQLFTYLVSARDYDRQVTDRVLSRLDGTDTPDLLTIYWPGLDHESHGDGGCGGIDLGGKQLEYLQSVIDPELARVRAKLLDLGVLDDTVFVICSDHGHRDVVKDDAHSVDIDPLNLDDEIDRVIEDTVYDDVYDVPLLLEGAFDTHAAMNGGILQLTLRNRATQNWPDAPDFGQDVLPVVGSIGEHRWNGELRNAVEDVLVRIAPNEPYQVVRPTRVKVVFDSIKVIHDKDIDGPGELTFELRINGRKVATVGQISANDGDVIAVNQANEIDLVSGMTLRVKAWGEDDDWWIFDDSLGTAEKTIADAVSLPAGPVTISSGDFELTFHVEVVPLPTYAFTPLPGWGTLCPLSVLNSEYVDAEGRIAKLAHPDRSGDILVLAAFRDGYYWGGKNGSTHGSLYPEDSYQAFMIGGTPLAQPKVIVGASVLDIAATVAHILGFDLRDKEGSSKVGPDVLPALPPQP